MRMFSNKLIDTQSIHRYDCSSCQNGWFNRVDVVRQKQDFNSRLFKLISQFKSNVADFNRGYLPRCKVQLLDRRGHSG